MTTPPRGAAAMAAVVLLSTVLAACGGDATRGTAGTAGAPPTGLPTAAGQVEGPSNEADVAFAQGMLPHHRQAVEMSELALGRAEDPEVLDIAEEISAAQEPEIRTLTAFLEAWDAEVPADDMPMDHMTTDDMTMDDMDHGGTGGMAGMMSPEDMTELASAEGPGFDRLFLQMMVEHHEGAVAMAGTEVDEGENPTARELAQTIIDSQQSEIERMQSLLGP